MPSETPEQWNIGEPGMGKTGLAVGIVKDAMSGTVPRTLEVALGSGLENCARCGGTHAELEWHPFKLPVELDEVASFRHWATCPVSGDPILMFVREDQNVTTTLPNWKPLGMVHAQWCPLSPDPLPSARFVLADIRPCQCDDQRSQEAYDLGTRDLLAVKTESDIHRKLAEQRAQEIGRLQGWLGHIRDTVNDAMLGRWWVRNAVGRALTDVPPPTPTNPQIRSDMLLDSGRYFDYLDPEGSDFSIEDIAHALSKLCRFNGHVRGDDTIYSVAQHCVLVSRLCPPEHALAGLLHDAAEAFTGDLIGPLKNLLPEYKVIEARIERAVLKRFGLAFPLDPSVKRADLQALAVEQRDVRNGPTDPRRQPDTWQLDGTPTPDISVTPLSPSEARADFLARYNALAGYSDGAVSR
jgi:hypothetical protein